MRKWYAGLDGEQLLYLWLMSIAVVLGTIFIIWIKVAEDRREANTHTAIGTIESVREVVTSGGMFGSDTTVYVTIESHEYELANSLEDNEYIKAGQLMEFTHYKGELIEEISVTKER